MPYFSSQRIRENADEAENSEINKNEGLKKKLLHGYFKI